MAGTNKKNVGKVYQKCRVCGVRIPSGFTNCDACYYKADKTERKEGQNED